MDEQEIKELLNHYRCCINESNFNSIYLNIHLSDDWYGLAINLFVNEFLDKNNLKILEVGNLLNTKYPIIYTIDNNDRMKCYFLEVLFCAKKFNRYFNFDVYCNQEPAQNEKILEYLERNEHYDIVRMSFCETGNNNNFKRNNYFKNKIKKKDKLLYGIEIRKSNEIDWN